VLSYSFQIPLKKFHRFSLRPSDVGVSSVAVAANPADAA